jgi:hypothetical protein
MSQTYTEISTTFTWKETTNKYMKHILNQIETIHKGAMCKYGYKMHMHIEKGNTDLHVV